MIELTDTGITNMLTNAVTLADEIGDLKPVDSLALSGSLIAVIAVCLLAAVVLIILTVLLGRPARRTQSNAPSRGAHSGNASKNVWRARIDDVVNRHAAGELERAEAFAELAAIARQFASSASGRQFESSTLTDLTYLTRTPANRQSLDTLKQTISALYPPEFADDDSFHRQSGEVSVQQAAQWVSNLVERWRF
ncbi:hypothetical protein [Bifidobacterium olomucense]|uniref:Uncharacterized protein n=1 Tax=Bifidobacterium olomucense TaxID=2675324 RepID=A0A7Y0HWB0_9BIFI|nr:hypothetical protein [Bifidobacterium sp. DSM 109959]NMM97458.1 hypothetical protein [Bifidobacterium sp. DSM 109959]